MILENKICSITQELLNNIPQNLSVQIPIVMIANNIGYKVLEFDPTESIENVSGSVVNASKTIYINGDEHPYRRRYTIAHEIGHAVLHSDRAHVIDYRQNMINFSGGSQIEDEAHQFAMELLMPAVKFKTLWRALDSKTDEIAARFGVPIDVAEYRAGSLGLLYAIE